jgi:uncharacterized protein
MNTTNQPYALITGGTAGIGYELARLFAKDNYNLVIVARTEEDLEQVGQELTSEFGVNVITISKDLFKPDATFELYEEIKQQGIVINVLVNDAGQGNYGLFVESDLQRQLDIIQLNISSLTSLTYLYLKDMVARKEGKILQLASVASELPGPWQAVYHATKAYVLSFTEAIRSEVKDTGVTITALQPGATDTDFFNKAGMQDSKIVQDESKLSDPAQVAKDGYEALMAGDDKVVSGFKNKLQTTMANVMPESMVADNMKKQQEPVDKKK